MGTTAVLISRSPRFNQLFICSLLSKGGVRHIKMRLLVCLFAVTAIVASSVLCTAEVLQKVDYTGHKVVSLVAKTKEQLDLLRTLREQYVELDFWTEPRAVGIPVHVRLSPAMQQRLSPLLDGVFGYSSSSTSSDTSFPYPDPATTASVMVENLQSVIDQEKEETQKAAFWSSPVGRYARLGDMHSWLDDMASKYSAIAETFIVGKTYEGRSIKGIKIGETSAKNKPIVWIHAGIHAREWIAPASCIYMINHLLTNYATDAGVKALVDGVAWYMIPSANPDGYEYSHLYDRMWRKTRTPNRGTSCRGTDPNRNWDDHFGLTGTSGRACSDIYRGPYPFSEPNTRALSSYILGIKDRIKVFFSLHCYSEVWLTSWGWTDHINPPDHVEIQRVAKGGRDALWARHGKKYDYGPGGATLYPAAGAEDDWARSKAGIKYSFTLELRPGPYSSNGFVLPQSQIIPTGEEVWSGIEWVVKDVYNVH